MRLVIFILLAIVVFSSGCISLSSTYSPGEAIEKANRIDGEEITITGELTDVLCRCTSLECSDDNPDCNTCSCSKGFQTDSGILVVKGYNTELNDSALSGIFSKIGEEYYLEIQ